MHGECGHRTDCEDQQIQIHRDLMRIEHRRKRDGRKSADERRTGELERDRGQR